MSLKYPYLLPLDARDSSISSDFRLVGECKFAFNTENAKVIRDFDCKLQRNKFNPYF